MSLNKTQAIVAALKTRTASGITQLEAKSKTGAALNSVNTTFNTLLATGLARVEVEPQPDGGRGRPSFRYFPTQALNPKAKAVVSEDSD